MLAGVVQRSMRKLRSDVEDKLNRLPLAYIDRQPRGDLLSRVTNDIDNVAQSLQQTMSQMLMSTLTIIGVLIVMITISPLLALIVVFTVPISLLTMKLITSRSKKRFIEQWTPHRHASTARSRRRSPVTRWSGRSGSSTTCRDRFDEKNEDLHESSFWAQFISGIIQPVMMFLGNLNYVVIAVDRRPARRRPAR